MRFAGDQTHVSMGRVGSYLHLFILTAPNKARSDERVGGISLLHLSWGHPRRALPVILTLWSPDFPHLGPFGLRPRLSDLVAEIL